MDLSLGWIIEHARLIPRVSLVRHVQLSILDKYRRVKEREMKQSRICDDIRMLNFNLIGVLRMCERHPAVHPSLIRELENKLKVRGPLFSSLGWFA